MLIADVLRTKGNSVVCVQVADTIAATVEKMAAKRIGAVVVQDSWGRIAGIFSERDLVRHLPRHGMAMLAQEVQALMTTPVITCSSNERLDAALAAMTTRKIRHLPVVDDGVLIGIVSIGDLVKHRLDEKELEASVLLEISRMRA
jgi:CBS domain-containing protein